ncbi:DinB family protein [Aneurinibacillus soli]|uniref:Putative metal-dependent hydrolase CB4_00122 n=1 Tax=Aneurinibacillus soli TaxID=1500254 RepID=A0A0U5AV31_9BACL|nr:bacillithiol transferase BstA [Aneurinibacillus soli]PYE58935.1 DinB family protein [Aneurinibacillus soli]BAU26050.1 putative metal-dependent hydrolase YfiT [Aneurinibacillus soli]
MNVKFPIGQFRCDEEISFTQVNKWIEEICVLPTELHNIVEGLGDVQLDTPYRDGGWTIRQVVHHVADSHMNAYIRFKLALTENRPTIKPYDEGLWAELSDSKLPVAISLKLIEALHTKWAALLSNLTESDLKKEFIHPDSGVITVERNIGIYAWHGKHHLAHIQRLLERKGWE